MLNSLVVGVYELCKKILHIILQNLFTILQKHRSMIYTLVVKLMYETLILRGIYEYKRRYRKSGSSS